MGKKKKKQNPTASCVKWTDYPARFKKRRLGVVLQVRHSSISEAGQEDHKVQISVDYTVRLSQRTNKQEKERKVTDEVREP